MKVACFVVVAATVSLAACDQPAEQTRGVPPPANSEFGRWVVVPASSQPYLAGDPKNVPLYSAWRLDTKTGSLEMCSYDPGGSGLPEGLSCSRSAEAITSD